MRVYTYIYIHTCIRAYICGYIYIYIHTYTHSSFIIHHSAFTIRHSVLVIHHSAFMSVCMHAKKHTGLFVSNCHQKLIKNGVQSSPGRLPGPTGLVILQGVLANLQSGAAPDGSRDRQDWSFYDVFWPICKKSMHFVQE